MVNTHRIGSALCAASFVTLGHASAIPQELETRTSTANTTAVYNACQAIKQLKKTSPRSYVQFNPGTVLMDVHYMTSSSQASTCVYVPYSAEDLQAGVEVIAKARVPYAVACSGHASNQGFSSTTGVQISMTGFQSVTVSSDNTYVDIGGGISWADIYSKLASSTVNVVGGRVPGPGIGGFVTGGGGYSWLTNQYGLTGDTLIQADMVLPNGTLITATSATTPDLFWAIKGGGNQFGFIYNFRLKAVPRPAKVYAGTKIYLADQVPAVLAAIADFSANNTDPKAQVIPTINSLAGIGGVLLLAYYDGIPTNNPFSMFNFTAQPQSFNSFIQSIPAKLQGGSRGAFNTLAVQKFSPALLAAIANETAYYGSIASKYSATFISYDVEPFLDYSQYATDAAWDHTQNGLPLNLYFAWTNSKYDSFWQQKMLDSVAYLQKVAEAEGQDVSGLLLYPNYALAQNPSEALYGSANLAKLKTIHQKYDPEGVTDLTTYFAGF